MNKLIEEAITNLDCLISDHHHHGVPAPGWMEAAVEALRSYRQAENLPLTLDELYMMDGEPVWIVDYPEDTEGWEFSEDAADYVDGRDVKAYGSSWVAYRHKPTDQKPAEETPLTLEELLELDGEPVWVNHAELGLFSGIVAIGFEGRPDGIRGLEFVVFLKEGYGKIWTAYRHKPEEVLK